MKTKNEFARAFIDLARLGRTDWRALALTILILALLISVATFGALFLPIPGMQAHRNPQNANGTARSREQILSGKNEAEMMKIQIIKLLILLFLLFGVSFFAFGEELYMRGWLTQTLGQYIRVPVVVVIIVAGSFALLHTQYAWLIKFEMFLTGLGFSVLSLRDRRLELAVGAHSMANVWAGLKGIIYTGQQHADFHISFPDLIVLIL
ncbi:CPBP family intramembrane glutamic endopeptidase [Paraburkholderia caledonica]|uniref:Membrane protease YdiL (CAAX protease family) n=1 Tax=Paraburkholderia caledonica TaxID=134536 RepID=A0AB73IRS2_9BURK|nr:membrane protease YdiL (CAAX protease family) [Paraburkholderia caledonica]